MSYFVHPLWACKPAGGLSRTSRIAAGAASLLLALTLCARADDRPDKPGPEKPAPEKPDRKLVHSGSAMGTLITLTVWGDDERAAADALNAVITEFARIDALMTTWTDDSEVSRINAAAGSPGGATVGDEVLLVIREAQRVSKLTGGAFDITVGAYQGLWKFDHDRDGTIPDPAEVAARLERVGWRRVVVNPRRKTVRLTGEDMRITLGGIAKGYAVDRAVALVRERGISDFILQAGGDLYVSGSKDGEPWTVGIRDPRGRGGNPFALLPLRDRTFSTSGDYERTIVLDGVRYHHILDPKTGQPARRCRSVTVMAATALTADALSTALFVLGPERGLRLVERLAGVEAVLVDADNEVHVSSGLRGKLVIRKPPTPGI